MIRILRLLVGLLCLCGGFANAALSQSPGFKCAAGGFGSTVLDACMDAAGKQGPNGSTPTSSVRFSFSRVSGSICYLEGFRENGQSNGTSSYACSGVQICPSNSTAVSGGSTCTCNGGFVEQDGACIRENQEPTADEKCAILAGDFNNIWREPPVNREGRVPGKLPLGETTTVCMPVDPSIKFGTEGFKPPPGCKHQFTAEMSFSYDNTNWSTDGTSWAQTHGSGLACVPGLDPNSNPTAPPTVQPDPPCKGTQGTVNGQSVCIAASSGHTNGVDWNQISDANGNTSSVRTDVSCKGEQCTVTTTTTPNASNNGGTGGSSTTNTSSVSRDQYCANNPKSVVCGGARDSSGVTRGQGGSGSGSGGDDGDDDVTAPGAPGGQIPELWKKKYPDGVKGVWDSKSADLKESGLGGLATSLMPSVSHGGSQPSWNIDLDFGGYWNWGTFTLSPDPAVWAALRAFTIICALVLARRLVFGG